MEKITRHSRPLSYILLITASLLLISLGTVFIALFGVSADSSGMSENPTVAADASLSSDEPDGVLINVNREERGVFIATVGNINFPSKKGLSAGELKSELDDIVKTVLENDLNSIYFQVRPCADALYDSDIFPTSAFLTGKQGDGLPDGFDPLGYLIEIAHKKGIAVHAWINPLRVSYGSSSKPATDLSALAENHPARLHPEWVTPYADGKLYFNTGIPEVRKLISDGVYEVVSKYDVDGVIFDDYFYPYPVSGAEFDDKDAYAKYGGEFDNIGDFRRDSVNKLIEACYYALKSADKNAMFGVAPFGIWQNDNGTNGGSLTSGLSSYSAIYCDPLAWIKGGYIDYIAPQIYWRFSTSAARYDVLVRWWNAQLSAYPSVKLYICHAAYNSAAWESDTEILQQVQYARSEKSYAGSIMYGYAAIKNNDCDLNGQLTSLYSDSIYYYPVTSDRSDVTISSPFNGASISSANTYIIGKCDPGYPLYFNGQPVSVTKKGYFSVYVSLEEGTNTFVFTQNGVETAHTIKRPSTSGSSSGSTEKNYSTISSFSIIPSSPSSDIIVNAGETITLKVTAPAGCLVTAALGTQKVILSPTINPPSGTPASGGYYKEVYTAELTLPSTKKYALTDLGNITYTASGSSTVSIKSVNVKILGEGAVMPIVVYRAESELKISPTSWYYDDYLPQAQGMTDVAVRMENGYYKLRMGGWVSADNIYISDSESVPLATVSRLSMSQSEKWTLLSFRTDVNVPVNAYLDGNVFYVTLFNSSFSSDAACAFAPNPIFDKVDFSSSASDNTVTYAFTLKNSDNYYGCLVSYGDGGVIVKVRNPLAIDDDDTPLTGKVIVLDAGHGGSDIGAPGPDSGYSEKNYNLDIVMAAAEKLRTLGATVILTRSDDSYVSIEKRLNILIDLDPSLCISVHQNSLDYSSDITKVRGLLSLYYSYSGKYLAKCVSSAMSSSLNRLERSVTRQRLAMVRNPKFPSALVEVGFITCVEECDMMRNEENIEKAAEGIAEGILSFYEFQQQFLDF